MKYLFLILFFLLNSCISSELQNAATNAGATIEAGKTKVAKGIAAGTENENYKSLNIEFSEFTNITENTNFEDISSIGAYTFIKDLTDKELKGFQKVEVKILNKNTTFEKIYDITQLLDFGNKLKLTNEFIKALQTGDTITYKKLIPKEKFGEDQQGIYKAFYSIDSIYGEVQNVITTGFDIKKDSIPRTLVNTQVIYNDGIAYIKLLIHNKKNKIIQVSIEGL